MSEKPIEWTGQLGFRLRLRVFMASADNKGALATEETLRQAGYVPASQIADVTAKLEAAEGRVRELEEERSATHEWVPRLTARVRELEEEQRGLRMLTRRGCYLWLHQLSDGTPFVVLKGDPAEKLGSWSGPQHRGATVGQAANALVDSLPPAHRAAIADPAPKAAKPAERRPECPHGVGLCTASCPSKVSLSPQVAQGLLPGDELCPDCDYVSRAPSHMPHWCPGRRVTLSLGKPASPPSPALTREALASSRLDGETYCLDETEPAQAELRPWPSSVAERNDAERCSRCKLSWVLHGAPCSPWCAAHKYVAPTKLERHPSLDAAPQQPPAEPAQTELSDVSPPVRPEGMFKHVDLEYLYQQDIKNGIRAGMTEWAARLHAERVRGKRAERIVDAVRALPDYFADRATEVFSVPGESGSMAYRDAVDHVNEALSMQLEPQPPATPGTPLTVEVMVEALRDAADAMCDSSEERLRRLADELERAQKGGG